MMRILLPQHTYNQARIKLVERITSFQIKKLASVKRAYVYLEFKENAFLEGFLGSEEKLPLILDMLSDNPIQILQDDVAFPDMKTILIEDSDDIENVPY